eukprot:g39618.t1
MTTDSHLIGNAPDFTITIPGNVMFIQQDRASRGDRTEGYSWDGVALGVLNIDSGPHAVSWLQDKSNPANYCPISPLSIISKVMEGVICSALKQHLLSNKLLGDAQFGFRQGYSAPDLITVLVQTWTRELNSR